MARKKETIANIRARQKRKAAERRKDRLLNKLAGTLGDIIGIGE